MIQISIAADNLCRDMKMISNSSHMIFDQTTEEPNVHDIKIVGNVVDSVTLEVSLLDS